MTKEYIGTKVVMAWPQNKPVENAPGIEGYAVKYEDGYVSWSPKDTFERSYRETGRTGVITGRMDFGGALHMLRLGLRVAREGWNGKGMWVELQRPDDHSKMTLPYFFMKTVDDNLVPWLASQTDMLANDWTVV